MTKPTIGTPVIVRPEVDVDQKYYGIIFQVVEHPRGKTIVIAATGNGQRRAAAR